MFIFLYFMYIYAASCVFSRFASHLQKFPGESPVPHLTLPVGRGHPFASPFYRCLKRLRLLSNLTLNTGCERRLSESRKHIATNVITE